LVLALLFAPRLVLSPLVDTPVRSPALTLKPSVLPLLSAPEDVWEEVLVLVVFVSVTLVSRVSTVLLETLSKRPARERY